MDFFHPAVLKSLQILSPGQSLNVIVAVGSVWLGITENETTQEKMMQKGAESPRCAKPPMTLQSLL